MDAALLTPSRFLKSEEFLGKDVTYTLTKVQLEKLESQQGPKMKGTVWFSETEKGWVLNRTNVECLKAMWGRETDHWLGKRVTLYPEPMRDPSSGEEITGIRVRGSPDIERDTTITITLPRKKPFQKLMKRTGGAAAQRPMSDPDTEATLIRAAIAKQKSPGELDDAWNAGLGKRISALPGDLSAKLRAEFTARKAETRAPPAPASDAPPPAADIPY